MRHIFWVFSRNQFLMSPLYYLSSHSDFGYEFAEIFVIEKRLPDSPSRGVDKIAYRYNILQNAKNIRDNNTELKQGILATTGTQRSRYFFPILQFLSDSDSPSWGVSDSPTHQVRESPTHRRRE